MSTNKIVSEARSWLGTPWHHMGDEHAVAIKGVCVDCAMLLVEVFKAAGLVPLGFDPRPYSMQWHLHRDEVSIHTPRAGGRPLNHKVNNNQPHKMVSANDRAKE